MFKANELRKKSDKDLIADLKKLKQEQMNLRFQKASKQLEASSRILIVRRQIAQIMTILNEKTSEGVKKNAAS